jgi:hypothetical protein
MPDINLPAVLVAALAAFVLSSTWYAVFGKHLAPGGATRAAERPPPWKLAVELLRGLILAAVLAGLASRGEVHDWSGGLLLGLTLWIAFPAVLWTGAMIWEDAPPKRAAIHAGDWLVKLLVLTVIVSVWH